MRNKLILAILLLCAAAPSQTSFHFVYKVTNVPADTNEQHLNVYTKNGNSINDFSSDRDNIVWNRCITRKDQPKYKFDYYNESYIKMPNNQLKKYRVQISGQDTINAQACIKIRLQAYDKGGNVLLWVPKDRQDYERYATGFIQDFDLVKLNSALRTFNLVGFPIRIEYTGYRGQVYDLVTAEPFDIDDARFEVDSAKRRKGYSAEKLKKRGKVTDAQYNAMKKAEEDAKKQAMEQMQKQ